MGVLGVLGVLRPGVSLGAGRVMMIMGQVSDLGGQRSRGARRDPGFQRAETARAELPGLSHERRSLVWGSRPRDETTTAHSTRDGKGYGTRPGASSTGCFATDRSGIKGPAAIQVVSRPTGDALEIGRSTL
jgi:hypothetical protein